MARQNTLLQKLEAPAKLRRLVGVLSLQAFSVLHLSVDASNLGLQDEAQSLGRDDVQALVLEDEADPE